MVHNFPIRAASKADFQSGVKPPRSKKPILIPKLTASLCIIAMCGMAAAQFISADTYTRYELLAPETHQFKIYYEVTETRVGARFHFNQIREGSEASDESVMDLATNRPLKFEVVTGAQAKVDSPPRFSARQRTTSRSIWRIRFPSTVSIVWQSSRLTKTIRVTTPKAIRSFSSARWGYRVTA